MVIRDRFGRSGLPVHVRFGPKASYIGRCREITQCAINGLMQCSNGRALFDDLVCAAKQTDWKGDTKRPGGLQVDNQLDLGRLLDR